MKDLLAVDVEKDDVRVNTNIELFFYQLKYYFLRAILLHILIEKEFLLSKIEPLNELMKEIESLKNNTTEEVADSFYEEFAKNSVFNNKVFFIKKGDATQYFLDNLKNFEARAFLNFIFDVESYSSRDYRAAFFFNSVKVKRVYQCLYNCERSFNYITDKDVNEIKLLHEKMKRRVKVLDQIKFVDFEVLPKYVDLFYKKKDKEIYCGDENWDSALRVCCFLEEVDNFCYFINYKKSDFGLAEKFFNEEAKENFLSYLKLYYEIFLPSCSIAEYDFVKFGVGSGENIKKFENLFTSVFWIKGSGEVTEFKKTPYLMSLMYVLKGVDKIDEFYNENKKIDFPHCSFVNEAKSKKFRVTTLNLPKDSYLYVSSDAHASPGYFVSSVYLAGKKNVYYISEGDSIDRSMSPIYDNMNLLMEFFSIPRNNILNIVGNHENPVGSACAYFLQNSINLLSLYGEINFVQFLHYILNSFIVAKINNFNALFSHAPFGKCLDKIKLEEIISKTKSEKNNTISDTFFVKKVEDTVLNKSLKEEAESDFTWNTFYGRRGAGEQINLNEFKKSLFSKGINLHCFGHIQSEVLDMYKNGIFILECSEREGISFKSLEFEKLDGKNFNILLPIGNFNRYVFSRGYNVEKFYILQVNGNGSLSTVYLDKDQIIKAVEKKQNQQQLQQQIQQYPPLQQPTQQSCQFLLQQQDQNQNNQQDNSIRLQNQFTQNQFGNFQQFSANQQQQYYQQPPYCNQFKQNDQEQPQFPSNEEDEFNTIKNRRFKK
jgi:hypothetical protein